MVQKFPDTFVIKKTLLFFRRRRRRKISLRGSEDLSPIFCIRIDLYLLSLGPPDSRPRLTPRETFFFFFFSPQNRLDLVQGLRCGKV